MSSIVDVVYVAGLGRNGSTLFERALGAADGFEAVGEMRHIFQRGFVENLLCACGAPFHECPRWEDVRRAAGLDDAAAYAAIADRAQMLDRTRNIPALIGLGPARPSFRRSLERHREVLDRLYRSLASRADGRILVDASKEASYAYLLSQVTSVRLHVVHLVRDPRAVAYSWTRKKRRPDVVTHVAYMRTLPPRTTAFRWLYQNLAAHGLRRAAASYQFLRYEDFVSDPETTLAKVVRTVAPDHGPIRHVEGSTIEVAPSHAVSGNPDRWRRGAIRVSMDDEWKRSFPQRDQRIVRMLTSPLFAAYGYARG